MPNHHGHQPEQLSDSTVRRMLEDAGPRLLDPLRAFRDAQFAQRQATRTWQRDELMGKVREAGAREAARLLYCGAKSALEADAEYRVHMDRSAGGMPEPWFAVQAKAGQLSDRLSSLDTSNITRWPLNQTTPADAIAGHRLAQECVDLAEKIYPGWEWTRLEAGIVQIARRDFSTATPLLSDLWAGALDEEVRYSAIRNTCTSLFSAHRFSELAPLIEQLNSMRIDDAASAYFSLESGAALDDESEYMRAREKLREHLGGTAGSYWLGILRSRPQSAAFSRSTLQHDLVEWIRRLGT